MMNIDDIILARKLGGGGGGEASGTKNISITSNGTTTHNVAAYASAEITTNVANSYSASDEDKVVQSGALVAQTSDTIDTNGTYDTTTISEVVVNVSGGGGDEIIETTIINNSSGDVTFDQILQACEDADYTLTYSDCILRFRAKGTNACASPPNNYTYNNHSIVVKNGAVWNVNYNRCYYKSGSVSPDSFTGIQLYETNNQMQNSGSIIDSNQKIINTYASAFHAVGGSGTTVTLYEIPVDWSDFLSTE